MLNVQEVETKRQKDEAFDIRKVVFVEEQNVPFEEEMDEHDDHAIHFVGYTLERRPVAASRLRFVDEFGKLERIAVLEEERGNGFGRDIILAMEDVIRSKGFSKSKLNAQTYAEDFYKKLGYETVSDEFMDAGIPHVTMVKDL
ncbi:GNAT family N-acetyltransferase [Alkalibacillus haloalkaliphilus]|uniref:GNAT family N-acetyltransferase n=1 Tax=Alkalibacillus haloalkaliphilus TaxID=94136 RepID=UPI00293668F4|nr:GNAT family N-acetyltransferase [Alkalibacillus haloalkaliphilus]MDV2582732.1 GNAT family N-acetyltransferase [Alkalibacillus haloalkaliphilus]